MRTKLVSSEQPMMPKVRLSFPQQQKTNEVGGKDMGTTKQKPLSASASNFSYLNLSAQRVQTTVGPPPPEPSSFGNGSVDVKKKEESIMDNNAAANTNPSPFSSPSKRGTATPSFSFLNEANQQAQIDKPPPSAAAPPSPPLSPRTTGSFQAKPFDFLKQAAKQQQQEQQQKSSSGTTSGGNGSGNKEGGIRSGPRRGVPILTRWWQTSDGCLNGFVFVEDEDNQGASPRRITTAPLDRGVSPRKGQVIETQDGKLYRLE